MKTILLVEDDAIIALSVEEALSGAGYDVLGPAATAKRALEIAEQTKPDLALLNINLQDGPLAGLEVARTLLDRWGVCSMFISGNTDIARRNADKAMGYVSKPYSAETISASVKAMEHVLEGTPTGPIPQGMELFRDNDAGA